jgi:hypothetical protein
MIMISTRRRYHLVARHTLDGLDQQPSCGPSPSPHDNPADGQLSSQRSERTLTDFV